MRKKITLTLVILSMLLSMLVLTACFTTGEEGGDGDVNAPQVASIQIDASTIPEIVYAGEFDVSVLRLFVTYDNGSIEVVGVTSDMIAVADREKLNKVGTQQIRVVYGNQATRFSIVIRDRLKGSYTLVVHGGRPIKINDEPSNIPNDTDSYDGVFSEGTTVTLDWTPVDGYYFVRWEDNGEFIDNQRITTVIMNTDHVYQAHSEPIVNYVTFVTNCDIGIGAIRTNILYESDIITLKKEGYVFDGWTTKEVTGDKAINCAETKITFPYVVEMDTKLYATWRPLGLGWKAVSGGYQVVSYSRDDKEVEIPEEHEGMKVISIAASAFANAAALERLYIPAYVSEIEDGFVRNCGRLQSIEVDPQSEYYYSNDGVLFSSGLTAELIAYPAGKMEAIYNVDNIPIIHDYAFYNALVGGITLPSNLKTVGNYAFDSVHINYVDFSAVVSVDSSFTLGDNLFNDNLQYVLLRGGTENSYLRYASIAACEDKITTNSDDVNFILSVNPEGTLLYKEIFNENSDNPITTLEIIGANRSQRIISLPRAIDGYNVSSIGVGAFNGCIYLEDFVIPRESYLERILKNAFDGTPYLAKLPNKSIIAYDVFYKYLGNSSTFVLPSNVKRIAEEAFRDNLTLKYIDLSQNNDLTYIGAYAFYGCKNFVGNSSAGLQIKSQMTTVANYAFAYSGITSFSLTVGTNIPNLTKIGEGAFSNCYELISVEIGPKTVDISDSAFLFTYSMQRFVLNSANPVYAVYGDVLYAKYNDSTSINTLFAYPAGKMSEVFDIGRPDGSTDLSGTITRIGNYALFMSNIVSVVIPANVTDISRSAFYIPGLVGVYFGRINSGTTYTEMFLLDDHGYGIFEPEFITIEHIDDNSLSSFFGNNGILAEQKYRASGDSSSYVVQNGLILRITDRVAKVVRSERNVDNITIPASVNYMSSVYYVTTIEPYAFMGYYLDTLYLGEQITDIYANALSYAGNLRHLYTARAVQHNAEDGAFGELFDNGMYVYVEASENNIAWYIEHWGFKSDKYLIDIDMQYPKATFTYKNGEEAQEFSPIYGVIKADQAPVPQKEGYNFVGWYDEDGNLIDLSVDFEIPYNMVLTCMWEAMRYKVIFDVGNNAHMPSDTTTYVTYGQGYEFADPIYNNNSQRLVRWYLLSSDGRTRITISSKGEWSHLADGDTITLYAEWEKIPFRLVYDTSDGSEVANRNAIVYYDENFTLDVPTKAGHVFMGWKLIDGTFITDASGVGLNPWSRTDALEYIISAHYIEQTDIVVNLYFTEGQLYKSVYVTYGADFEFNYNVSDMSSDWADKAELFCGWYDSFNATLGSGVGTRYTDETGKGLFKWSNGSGLNLYAQWAIRVSDGAELDALDDMGRSIILTGDVTITKPIGSATEPYTGNFNGAGHTVTLNYSVDLDNNTDNYIGFIAYNKGIIRNVKLAITLVINDNNETGSLYVGSYAGRNEGEIIGTAGRDVDAQVDITVNINGNNTGAFIGGLVGRNDNGGVITNIGIDVNSLKVNVSGEKYDTTLHGSRIIAGSLLGAMYGGKVTTNKTCRYFYTDDNDAFRDVKCGYIAPGISFDVLVAVTKTN